MNEGSKTRGGYQRRLTWSSYLVGELITLIVKLFMVLVITVNVRCVSICLVTLRAWATQVFPLSAD